MTFMFLSLVLDDNIYGETYCMPILVTKNMQKVVINSVIKDKHTVCFVYPNFVKNCLNNIHSI